MAPRSLASSTLKSDTKLKATPSAGGDEFTGRNMRSRTSKNGDLSARKPRLEGFRRGSWWELDIIQQRNKNFLVKYLSPFAGEEYAWLPLKHLRLKSRRSDDWDCNILRRGMDVSVNCTHPDLKEPKLHSMGLYDAKITGIKRAAHDFECTCQFHVRFYCPSTEDPTGSTRLLSNSSATMEVTMSTVSILQRIGIVPFYEVLESLLSRKWNHAIRWSNDAFHLAETKLHLDGSTNSGDNRLYQVEAALDDDETELVQPEEFTCSSRFHHSHEQETVSVPPQKSRSNTISGQFPGSEIKYSAEYFTGTGCDPLGGNTNFSRFESDISAAKRGMSGGANRKDSESRRVKDAVVDKVITQLDRTRVKRLRDNFTVSSGDKHGVSPPQINKRIVSEQKERNPLNVQEKSGNPLGEANSEDEIVDIGGSSDEDDMYTRPSVTDITATNLQTFRSNEGVERRGLAGLRRDDDSLERKLEACTSQKEIPSVGIPNSDEDEKDCEVLEMDPTIKRGVAERTQRRRSGKGDVHHIREQIEDCGGETRQPPGRRFVEGFRKRGRPALQRDDGSSDRKPDGGFNNLSPEKNISASAEDDDACKVLEMNHTIKRSVEGRTRGLKIARKNVVSLPGRSGIHSEDHEMAGETNKPLNKLRRRSSPKKQVRAGGAGVPASLPQDGKLSFGKGNGKKGQSRKKSSCERLYVGLLDVSLEQEKEKPMDTRTNVEMERKAKCGLNSDWDPTSFKYLIPTLEEKQAELQKQTEQRQQQQQQVNHYGQPQNEHQQQQPKESVAEEGPREEKILLPVQEGEDTTCRHNETYLNEAVGRICTKCAFVTTTIEALVPFVGIRQPPHYGETSDWDMGRRSPDTFQEPTEYQKTQAEEEVTLMTSCNLPPRMRLAMHPHQKDGFAFLWKNLACGEGSNRRMREDRNAGCVLSHAPGTGKTFLVIAFLQSYMNQFPSCRPMIVVPKIMLRQWEKEFQRWKSDISVYILNTARESGKRILQRHESDGLLNSRKPNSKWNISECRLGMLVEWQKSRSALLVSYTLFSLLTDESKERTSEDEMVRKFLLVQPSLLILDEGHFPRNNTRARRSLMAVRTNTRILLSGTLFQNNFRELFNILYLVRPGFVERFASFVPKSSDQDRRSNLKKPLDMEEITKEAENRARKLFVEEVGMKIEQGQSSKVHSDQLDFGLERLGTLTTEFIHHHTGEVLATLPGLRDFAVVLKPTQQQCRLIDTSEKNLQSRSTLEREIALSHISIHPGLVGVQGWAECTRIVDIKTTRNLKESKSGSCAPATATDPSDGVKTKFVFDLLCFSKLEKEKVLVFSQYIAPLELLANMFIAQFKWRDDAEYLRLNGEVAMDERQRIIEKFNNPSGEACVLLASTRACGEGISLIGASRVVFLDVLWNPAVIKQAMSRAFRLGQKKIVYVYRLIASDTIEESKYKTAVRKDWLSRSIFSASQGEAHRVADLAVETAAEVHTPDAGGESRNKDSSIDGNCACSGEALGEELPNDAVEQVSLSMSEEIHRIRKTQELLAWEVDATTCKDVMLEMVLGDDTDADRKTFVKVIEHGSDFREKTLPFGPDAREWFLEGVDYSEPPEVAGMKDEEEADEEDEEDI